MNIAIVSYRSEYNYIIDHLYYCCSYFISAVITPNSFMKDIKVPEYTALYCDIGEIEEDIDMIIVLPISDQNWMIGQMKKAISRGISVLCSALIDDCELQILYREAEEKNICFRYVACPSKIELIKDKANNPVMMDTVFIAVGSLLKGINTSKYVHRLWEEMKKQGFDVGVVGTEPELVSIGCEYLPLDMIIESDLEKTELNINYYFRDYITRNKHDVIIIQIPNEGILKYDNKAKGGTGIYLYLMSQAINIDYGLFFAPSAWIDSKEVEQLFTLMKIKYGIHLSELIGMPVFPCVGCGDENDYELYHIDYDIEEYEKQVENDIVLIRGENSSWEKDFLDVFCD